MGLLQQPVSQRDAPEAGLKLAISLVVHHPYRHETRADDNTGRRCAPGGVDGKHGRTAALQPYKVPLA
jgi:hypothetical protein